MLPGKFDRFANRRLACSGVCKDIPFDEKPFRTGNPALFDVLGCEVAGYCQTGAHSPLGIRSNDADTCSSGLIHDDRVADVNAELFEFARIKEPIPVITDTTDEGGLSSK